MAETKPVRACVICGKPAVEAYKPFCSKRCKQVDLNRWLTGAYALPAAEIDDPDQDDEAARPRRPSREEDEG